MDIFRALSRLFKGDRHAGTGTVEERVSGGDGRERRVLHPVPAVCKRALSDIRGIRVLAAACADERSRDPGTMPQDPLCRESRALIAAAKETGCLVDARSVPGTRYTLRTGESEVRLVQKEQVYYKIKNPFAKAHLKKHPAEYVLFEHVVHNALFPDCRLEFLGVAEDLHEARLVYRQNAVRSDTRPDDRQIATELSLFGLWPEGRYSFGNDYIIVTDVGQDGDNVLLDDDGNLRFIDPIIGFKPSFLQLLSSALADDSAVNELVYAVRSIDEAERRRIMEQQAPVDTAAVLQ